MKRKGQLTVTGGDEQITPGVTANSEVARGVHAEEAIGEVALHVGGEPVEVVVVFNEGGDVGVLGPALSGEFGDVAAETARIVTETSPFRVGGCVEEEYGAEVD